MIFGKFQNLEGPMLIMKPLDSLDNRIDEDAGDDCDVDVTVSITWNYFYFINYLHFPLL